MVVKNNELQIVENKDIVNGQFTIDNNIKSIKNECFEECKALKKVIISDGIIEIPKKTFSDCSNLTEVILPSTIKVIGASAFFNCLKLEKINISEVIKIDEGAFYNCISLEHINIPESLRYIGDYAFQNCRSIKSLNIHNNIDYIGVAAFKGCDSLDNVTNLLIKYLTETDRINRLSINDINKIINKLKEALRKEILVEFGLKNEKDVPRQKIKR